MYMFESFLKTLPKNRSELVNDLEIPEVTVTPYELPEFEDIESVTSRDTLPTPVSLTVTEEVEEKSLNTASSVALTNAMTDSDIDYDRIKRFKNRRNSDPWDLMKAANRSFSTSYLDSLYKYRHGRYYDKYWSKYRSDSYIPWSTYYRYGRPYYKYDDYGYWSYKYDPVTYKYNWEYEPYSRYYYRYGLPSYDYSWRYSDLKPWRYSSLYPWRYSYQTTSDYIDDVLAESRLARAEYREKLKAKMTKYFDEECKVFTPDDPGLTRLEEALLDLDYKAYEFFRGPDGAVLAYEGPDSRWSFSLRGARKTPRAPSPGVAYLPQPISHSNNDSDTDTDTE